MVHRYPLGVGGVDCRLLKYHVLPAKKLDSDAVRLQSVLTRGQPDAPQRAAELPALQEAADAQAELQEAFNR